MLTTFATGVQGTTLKPAHIPLVAALGLCLFFNQLLYILGLNLAGVTLAACMQPAIPVFTALLSMLCGQELASTRRVSGAYANADETSVQCLQFVTREKGAEGLPCCIARCHPRCFLFAVTYFYKAES